MISGKMTVANFVPRRAGGCGLATACDLVLATKSARFGYPEVKIGFVPAMVMAILRRNVSEKRAFELATRGFEFDTTTAEIFGLINQIFDDETFAEDVINYVAGYAKVSRSAVILSKRLLYQMDGMNFDAALQRWATASNPFYAGPYADLLSLLPFLLLVVLLWCVARGMWLAAPAAPRD